MTLGNLVELSASVVTGGIITAIGTYFTITKKFREYIQDAMGKVPEVSATVTYKQRMATFEELTQLREEFNKNKQQLEDRAREFRERTEKKLQEIDAHVQANPHRVIALLRDTKGLL